MNTCSKCPINLCAERQTVFLTGVTINVYRHCRWWQRVGHRSTMRIKGMSQSFAFGRVTSQWVWALSYFPRSQRSSQHHRAVATAVAKEVLMRAGLIGICQGCWGFLLLLLLFPAGVTSGVWLLYVRGVWLKVVTVIHLMFTCSHVQTGLMIRASTITQTQSVHVSLSCYVMTLKYPFNISLLLNTW